jgi:hypothetical protein
MARLVIRLVGALLVLGMFLTGMATDAAAASAVSVAAQDDPATVVRRFFDARNRYDVEGTLALVTDDYHHVGGPACPAAKPCVGKDAFRPSLQGSIMNRSQFTIVGAPQVTGTKVVARIEVRGDDVRRAGVERIVLTVTMEVRGDQLASHVAVPDASDPQTAQYLAFIQNQPGTGAPTPGMPNTGGGGTRHAAAGWRTLGWALLGLGLVGGLGLAGRAGRRRAAPR